MDNTDIHRQRNVQTEKLLQQTQYIHAIQNQQPNWTKTETKHRITQRQQRLQIDMQRL